LRGIIYFFCFLPQKGVKKRMTTIEISVIDYRDSQNSFFQFIKKLGAKVFTKRILSL